MHEPHDVLVNIIIIIMIMKGIMNDVVDIELFIEQRAPAKRCGRRSALYVV